MLPLTSTATMVPYSNHTTTAGAFHWGTNATLFSSTETDEEFCALIKSVESLVLTITYTIIFCLSVIGNSVVIVTIVQQRSMRTITNLYLLNLALTDLLLSVICMPPTLVQSLFHCWIFGPVLCKVFAYLQPVAVAASAYTLAVIAIERYYAICRPLHSRLWQTKGHAAVMISLVWTISLLSNVGALFMFESPPLQPMNCGHAPYSRLAHFVYQVYITTVLLVIPLVLMVALYGYVIHTLKLGMRIDFAGVVSSTNGQIDVSIDEEDTPRKASLYERLRDTLHLPGKNRFASADNVRCPTIILNKSTPPTSESGLDTERSSKLSVLRKPSADPPNMSLRSTHSEKAFIAKKRVIRMLLVIVVIFFICWTPSYIFWLVLMTGDLFGQNFWNTDVNTVFTIMTYLSSCTNPITYCFLNNKFRQAFLMSFGCRKAALRHHMMMHKASAPNSAVFQNPSTSAQKLNGMRKMSPANNALLSRCNARPFDKAARLATVEERRRSSMPVEACGLLTNHKEHCSPVHRPANGRDKDGQSTIELRTAGSVDALDRVHSQPPRKESAV